MDEILFVFIVFVLIFVWIIKKIANHTKKEMDLKAMADELRTISKAVQEINRRMAEQQVNAAGKEAETALAKDNDACAESVQNAPEDVAVSNNSLDEKVVPNALQAEEEKTSPAKSNTELIVENLVPKDVPLEVKTEEEEPPPKPPREPSQFELRLLALRNWFIYGNAAGRAKGEAVEKMLATTWLLRAGILVILITSVFLLKLSIERGMLAPEGRVALSYLCGAALLYGGLCNKMRRAYWSLGQALVGIGLGMFYFSSFAMVSMYHLTSPVVGGAVMVLVTITSGVLADRLASLSIAMVSMLGGFATPLLLSTGAKNFPGLAAYLLLLGVGVLWLANRRNWQQLTWLAMLFTYGIFGMAYRAHFAADDFACYQTALLLFFILYSTSIFIHNIRLRLPAGALEIVGLLGNSLFFFWYSSAAILRVSRGERLSLAPLTIGLALYYLAHAVFLQKRRETSDRNMLLIFCALCGFYLSLTAPVLLTGHWLGTAWALQGLMMLWLGYKLESRFIRGCAWVLYVLTLLRLYGWDFIAYQSVASDGGSFWMASLSRCLQFAIPVVCLALGGRLVRKNLRAEDVAAFTEMTSAPRINLVAGVFLSLAFLVGFLFLRLEIAADLRHCMPSMWLAGVNLIWIGAIILSLKLLNGRIAGWWWPCFLLLACGVLIRSVYDFCMPSLWNCCRPDFLWAYSIGTMVNTLVLVVGIWYAQRLLPNDRGEWGRRISIACNVAWPLLLFAHSTRELQTIIDHKLPGLEGGGISVLWSIFAFALLFIGLRKSNKLLRYIGLVGFAIIVVKVFFMDMGRLDAMFRVGAFLVFGVLLMCAAFIYLKFWHGKEEK